MENSSLYLVKKNIIFYSYKINHHVLNIFLQPIQKCININIKVITEKIEFYN